MELSRPTGDSSNDFIDRESYSFPFYKFDDTVRSVTKYGIGAELAKQDIKHAF